MATEENSGTETRGHIDGVFNHQLTGWFFQRGLAKTNLTLSVDGHACMTVDSQLPRPDVASRLGCEEQTGFCFDLSRLDLDEDPSRIVELTIRHDVSGFSFNEARLSYCRDISIWFEQIREIFRPEYYICKNELFHLSGDLALQHFLTQGIFELKDPCPWFSNAFYSQQYPDLDARTRLPLIDYLEQEPTLSRRPSSLFDPRYYRDRYEDLSGMNNLLSHFSRYGNTEGRAGVERALPNHIRREFNEVIRLDPKVATAANGLGEIVRYPQISPATYLAKLIHGRFGDRIKAIICVPFISRGGADLISTYLFRAYQQAFGKEHVLMIVTDRPSIDVPGWLDDGSQVICVDDESTFSDNEEKLVALHGCIGQLSPEKIINVNSHLTWQLFERYGPQLSSVADLFAYLFCFDYDVNRNKVGYITDYLPQTIRYLKSVYFDNKAIVETLSVLYGFPDEHANKLHTVYVPAAEGLKPTVYENGVTRETILWVGRLSLQKRPDVLVEIARSMPGQMFDVYGPAGNAECSGDIIAGNYPNIRYQGTYDSLEEVNLDQYLCFLNTSEWDGLPTIIIQMMALGLPVVTSPVCGIPELVDERTGWLVENFDAAPEYIAELRKVEINSQLSLEKVAEALSVVKSRHIWTRFHTRLESLGAFAAHTSSTRVNAFFEDRRKSA